MKLPEQPFVKVHLRGGMTVTYQPAFYDTDLSADCFIYDIDGSDTNVRIPNEAIIKVDGQDLSFIDVYHKGD